MTKKTIEQIRQQAADAVKAKAEYYAAQELTLVTMRRLKELRVARQRLPATEILMKRSS